VELDRSLSVRSVIISCRAMHMEPVSLLRVTAWYHDDTRITSFPEV